jgi:hypothetical protein
LTQNATNDPYMMTFGKARTVEELFLLAMGRA